MHEISPQCPPLISNNLRSATLTGLTICTLLWFAGGCEDATSPSQPETPSDSDSAVVPMSDKGFEFTPSSTRRDRRKDATEWHPTSLPVLTDVAADCDLVFTYDNGAQGRLLMVEASGGGIAWLDYDHDGWPDAYFSQGGNPISPGQDTSPHNCLFRSIESKQFVEVGTQARVDDRAYGQGCAAADFDNDGFTDLFVTNLDENRLFRNMGDGTFEDVTDTANIDGKAWSSSAAWGDVDADGDLDLYVCNYLQYDVENPRPCEKDDLPAMCHPRDMTASPDQFFENLGDGRFRSCAKEIGFVGPGNNGLAVIIADLNNDARPDVYVCNDTTANFYFQNEGTMQFSDSALESGLAMNSKGESEASMGIAFGDYDHDGRFDLCLTHYTFESNTLYRNLGVTGFQDVSAQCDVEEHTLRKLAFGTAMVDLDGDGKDELFFANGHIDSNFYDGEGFEMTPQLLSFDGNRFHDISAESGEYFSRKLIGRGAALSDFDQDGDPDLCVVHQNSPVALLRNDSPRRNWLKLKFVGTSSNRDCTHLRVTTTIGETRIMKELVGGSTYCSSHEPVLCFPCGDESQRISLEVRWPTGRIQTIEKVEGGQLVTLVEDGPLLFEPLQLN